MSSANGHAKRSEKGLLTPDNCVVALIDHQPQMLFGTSYPDRQSIINNTVALRQGYPRLRGTGRPDDGGDAQLHRLSLAADSGGISQADAHRAVVHERVGRPELRGRDQGHRAKKDRAGGALDRNLRRPSDHASDQRRVRDLRRRGLLRRRQPARARQRHEARDPGRRKTRHVALRHARVAARLGPEGYLRRGHGHREDPLRRLRHRRRVRLHDGAQGAADASFPSTWSRRPRTTARRPPREDCS